MNYKVEFIVCFDDNRWELSPVVIVDRGIVSLGNETVIEHATSRLDNIYSDTTTRRVVHYRVYSYIECEDECENDSNTLTSYDIGDGESVF